jgi:hypothetical protein
MCTGERGHVRRPDYASDGKRGAKLVAALFVSMPMPALPPITTTVCQTVQDRVGWKRWLPCSWFLQSAFNIRLT